MGVSKTWFKGLLSLENGIVLSTPFRLNQQHFFWVTYNQFCFTPVLRNICFCKLSSFHFRELSNWRIYLMVAAAGMLSSIVPSFWTTVQRTCFLLAMLICLAGFGWQCFDQVFKFFKVIRI